MPLFTTSKPFELTSLTSQETTLKFMNVISTFAKKKKNSKFKIFKFQKTL